MLTVSICKVACLCLDLLKIQQGQNVYVTKREKRSTPCSKNFT